MTSTSLDAGPVVNQSNFRPWARLLSPATQGELATKQQSASCWKVSEAAHIPAAVVDVSAVTHCSCIV